MNIWIQEICGISCIDMKFLTFWFEFEYDLKFTLDNVKYMLSNVN